MVWVALERKKLRRKGLKKKGCWWRHRKGTYPTCRILPFLKPFFLVCHFSSCGNEVFGYIYSRVPRVTVFRRQNQYDPPRWPSPIPPFRSLSLELLHSYLSPFFPFFRFHTHRTLQHKQNFFFVSREKRMKLKKEKEKAFSNTDFWRHLLFDEIFGGWCFFFKKWKKGDEVTDLRRFSSRWLRLRGRVDVI